MSDLAFKLLFMIVCFVVSYGCYVYLQRHSKEARKLEELQKLNIALRLRLDVQLRKYTYNEAIDMAKRANAEAEFKRVCKEEIFFNF